MYPARLVPFLAGIVLVLLVSCGGGGGRGSSAGGTIQGSVQKGPFVQGSDVTVQGLDSSLALTGTGYFTKTITDNGVFTLDVPLHDPYIEVRTTGYYFNEVSGRLSAGPISMTAIAPFGSGNTTVQVNLLTTLERDRIVALMRNGAASFEDARQRAEREILQAFNIPLAAAAGRAFTAFDMERNDSAAQALIAVSSIVQGANSEAQLTELVAKLAADLADHGVLGPASAAALAAQSAQLDPPAIRTNLQDRFRVLASNVVVPDPGTYIDLNRPILGPTWTVHEGDPSAQGLAILLAPSTPGTLIYYRTDDALSTVGPWSTGGQWRPYSGQISFSAHPGTLVLSVYAQSPSVEGRRSEVVTRTFQLDAERTRTPVFTPAAGTYAPGQLVQLSDPWADAVIYYTTDGTTPTTASPRYVGPIQFPSGSSTLLKAMALSPLNLPSVVVTSWYQIDPAYVDQGWPGFASLDAARQKFVGRWIGRVVTPWLDPYNGIIDFRSDGTYTVRTLDNPYPLSPQLIDFSFLYYGVGDDNPAHTWQLAELDGTGQASGGLVIGDDSSWTLDLKGGQMSADGNHLRFELWNFGSGPMHYELTRYP